MARTAKAKPAKKAKKATRVTQKKTSKPPVKKNSAEAHGLSASVVGVDGKAKGRMTLPKEVFGEKVNKTLIAQAVRVYLANQRTGGAATKTRGMVEGSTRKIYAQKGTGRARHGNIRAPIFVGGGIVFGPVPHDFSLSMPVKMKRKALACALSLQLTEGNIAIVDGLDELKPKTKFIALALKAVAQTGSVLLVYSKDTPLVARSARNIAGVTVTPSNSLNTYDVMAHQKVVFAKEAVAGVKDILTKEM